MITVYELPLSWQPDPPFINYPIGMQYLAWKLGESETQTLWAIEAINDSPSPALETLLPEFTRTFELEKDTPQYGYRRTCLPQLSIDAVVADFYEQLGTF
jgi:hypothetical protein